MTHKHACKPLVGPDLREAGERNRATPWSLGNISARPEASIWRALSGHQITGERTESAGAWECSWHPALACNKYTCPNMKA